MNCSSDIPWSAVVPSRICRLMCELHWPSALLWNSLGSSLHLRGRESHSESHSESHTQARWGAIAMPVNARSTRSDYARAGRMRGGRGHVCDVEEGASVPRGKCARIRGAWGVSSRDSIGGEDGGDGVGVGKGLDGAALLSVARHLEEGGVQVEGVGGREVELGS